MAALTTEPNRAATVRERWGGWKRPPFLPLPDRDYVQFRMQTAYGSKGRPEPGDLVAYLNWCREFRT